MQASVAVAEALEAGNLSPPPVAGGADFAVAALAMVVAALAVAVSFVLVSYDARARQGRLRRILDLGPSLRSPRLQLAFFAGLLAAAEMLRLPFFRRVMCPRRHVMPCLAYPLIAHGIAEPGLLACVLLLLRASVGGARLPGAALSLPLACLPFLTAHVLVLATPETVAAYPGQLAHAADGVGHCAYPAYAALLLLALAAVYVPLLASACWDVAAVAINRRVRSRAYALAALVVVPLPVQVVVLALTSVWDTPRYTSPTVGLIGFLAVGIAAAATLAILVLLPVYDALALVEQQPVAAAGKDTRELGR
ncbi:uncharacterized protein LOC133894842 [Phragmites australis]|uniref:uncharacterized protein LOC133894842 n=1 Tax=Phragmites australis TaxID=29695 RepID=UPI002D768718|nr:uncharacterized protein LOC133894842 [Phragmites australis]